MQFVGKKIVKHTVLLIKYRLLNSVIIKEITFLEKEVDIAFPFKIVYRIL